MIDVHKPISALVCSSVNQKHALILEDVFYEYGKVPKYFMKCKFCGFSLVRDAYTIIPTSD